MTRFRDFQTIRAELDNEGGILSISMGELRDAYQVFRLGVHVRKGIHDTLESKGIGHYPAELPVYQDDRVRLYTLGSAFANMVKDLDDLTEEADQRLRDTVQSDHGETIKRIKELVV